MSELIPDGILEASKSDLLFTLGVVGAMKHFNLSHDAVHQAIDIAYKTRGIKAINRLHDTIRVQRLRRRVVNREVSYPLIHRRLLIEGISIRVLGKEYDIAFTWVSQIRREFKDLAVALGVAVEQLIPDIEQDARSFSGSSE